MLEFLQTKCDSSEGMSCSVLYILDPLKLTLFKSQLVYARPVGFKELWHSLNNVLEMTILTMYFLPCVASI